jgi:amidohydrolase
MEIMPERLEDLRGDISRAIDRNERRLIALSHRIHQNPELGFQEIRAAKRLTAELERAGFKINRGVAGLETAFAARFRGKSARPAVAFVAEYDALAGLGHACGHNIIAACAVGAGIGLASVIKELKGTAVVLGTPAEEGGGGKIIMLKKGYFRNVDVAMMMHPSNKTFVGRKWLAVTGLKMVFQGKAAHAAASPEKGINALNACIETFNAINALRQHLPEDVRIHGIITDGGQAANIVPERAEAVFYVRTLEQDFLEPLMEKVAQCARGAALSTGAKVKVEEMRLRYDARRTNEPLLALLRKNMKELRLRLDELPERGGLGSSDFGNVTQALPAAHPTIAILPARFAGHSRQFERAAISARGDRAVIRGAKLLALTAFDLITRPELLAEVKRAHKKAPT